MDLFLTGIYLSSYGLLIPLYSQATGHDETYYSFLFMVRSAAYISGSIAIKYLIRHFTMHSLFVGQLALITISMYLCTLSYSLTNLTIMYFISGSALMATNVLAFSTTAQIFQNHHPDFWIILLEIAFGFGAAITPLLIMLL
jgi:MFS family permease